jgi:hypothetical protein
MELESQSKQNSSRESRGKGWGLGKRGRGRGTGGPGAEGDDAVEARGLEEPGEPEHGCRLRLRGKRLHERPGEMLLRFFYFFWLGDDGFIREEEGVFGRNIAHLYTWEKYPSSEIF